jgi:hypothetical protein
VGQARGPNPSKKKKKEEEEEGKGECLRIFVKSNDSVRLFYDRVSTPDIMKYRI